MKVTRHFKTDFDAGAFTPDGAVGTGAAFGGGIVATSVTDGTTTVIPASQIKFTSGGVVTDLTGGVAGVAVTASSPLTTKGDIYGHSTVDARIPVGSDTFVLTADSTQTLGVKWAAPSGGGGITHSYIGYNTTGGSLLSMAQRAFYCCPVTPGTNGFVGSVSCYIEDDGSTHVADLHVAIFDDNSGAPGKIIAFGGVSPLTTFIPISTYGQRWVSMPIGYWATGGTQIWLGVGSDQPSGSGALRLAYDTGGADYTFTASGDWVADATFYSPTNTTHKHSIRADFLT
jgi:hypothetical protein